MHRLLEKLHKDHLNLEKILTLLSQQLDNLVAGRETNIDLKIELLEYLESYADVGHHPLENRIFDSARKHLDSDGVELMNRLQSQHDNLILLTRRFRQTLENVLQGGVMPRDEVEVQGREFVALQKQHLDLEEGEAFPLVAGVMTEADWKEVEAGVSEQSDPVFESPDKVRFQNLFEYLNQADS